MTGTPDQSPSISYRALMERMNNHGINYLRLDSMVHDPMVSTISIANNPAPSSFHDEKNKSVLLLNT